MTPQSPSQPSAAASHLTEEQFGELLAASPRNSRLSFGLSSNPGSDLHSSPAQAHLLACERCAAEFAGVRESLSLFRQAGSAYADDQLRRLPPCSLPVRSYAPQPAYWAAAALLLAMLPMQVMVRRSLNPHPSVAAVIAYGVPDSTPVGTQNHAQASLAESDEALLEDVNREISASVPTPMQTLDNPIAANGDAAASVRDSIERKD